MPGLDERRADGRYLLAMPAPGAQPERTVLAITAPAVARDNPFTRSPAGLAGLVFLVGMFLACVATLPWAFAPADATGADPTPRFNAGSPKDGRFPPSWWPVDDAETIVRLNESAARRAPEAVERLAESAGLGVPEAIAQTEGALADALREHWPPSALGTDVLGRSLLVRVLTGGGISLGIGVAAALISVGIGTVYGGIAGYAGGKLDAVLMRIVDVLYSLPYILLVVLLAVAVEGLVEDRIERGHLDLTERQRMIVDLATLLVAIGGVSWLTMARVIRGQVLSLKNQPFVEAARAAGAPTARIFLRHLLPNLLGPIIVYATLTVPQAILQESFLSFLGIGVKPPLPSWGNLAADGLPELNTYRSHWWLLLFPCVLLGLTLLALNFVGEGLREAFDPKRARR